jgi:hypothetical protein
VNVREAIKAIEADDWFLDLTRGSHRQYKPPRRHVLHVFRYGLRMGDFAEVFFLFEPHVDYAAD